MKIVPTMHAMRRAARSFVLALGLCASMSCSSAPAETATGTGMLIAESATGNVTLYVGNQSRVLGMVDIAVHLDGKLILDATYDFTPQHASFASYRFDVAPGLHLLRVSADGGAVAVERSIEVTGEHWGLVEFLFDPDDAPKKEVRFSFRAEPFHFR